MTDPPLLRIRGLQKRYTVPALIDFDLELGGGEMHALIGANGAGKSTLARIISGLIRPDAGQMELSGRDFAPRRRRRERAGVQIVQQELTLLPTLSVAENLFLSRTCRGGPASSRRRIVRRRDRPWRRSVWSGSIRGPRPGISASGNSSWWRSRRRLRSRAAC